MIATIALLLLVQSPERRPIPELELPPVNHVSTATRIRSDPTTKQPVQYKVNSRIDIDPDSGNAVVSWEGYEGTRKRMVRELPTRLSAVISADVKKIEGVLIYEYEVFEPCLVKKGLDQHFLGSERGGSRE